jgi:hypothetical protein
VYCSIDAIVYAPMQLSGAYFPAPTNAKSRMGHFLKFGHFAFGYDQIAF